MVSHHNQAGDELATYVRMKTRKSNSKRIRFQKPNFTAIFALFGLLLGLVMAFWDSPAFAQRFNLSSPTPVPEEKTLQETGARAITDEEAEPIWQAYLERYQAALLQHSDDPMSGLFTPVLDQAFLTEDGKSAVLWLALQDQNGYILHTEPGLVLARLSEDGWRTILPKDADWESSLEALPEELIPSGLRHSEIKLEEQSLNSPIWGYYLPYVAGTSRRLEGSVLHFHSFPALGYPSCKETYCRYAYDFTDQSHFPLVSSRAGTVIASRDSCSDGDSRCTNYIVLKDAVGGAYQIYLHLAHGTIPDRLTNGTYIGRGNYIGDTDDTGYSTSEHVHFMVVNSFYYAGDGYPWGHSVDVRFNDVSINDGIPRTCYEVTHLPIYDGARDCLGNKADPLNPNNDWYLSGNVGASPPSGYLTRPADGATVLPGTGTIIDVTAQTSDDVAVVQAVLQAKLDGQWREIGPRIRNPYSNGVFDWDVDLCQVGPLNGPLEIALKLWDHEGNVVEHLSRRTIHVDHACPPPSSQMTAPTSYDGTGVKLNWTATGAGVPIREFQLQWREGNAAWSAERMLTLSPSARSTWFIGSSGKQFGFRLRAIDANGQAEAWPANDAAEITHTFPSTCQPDAAEPDNTPEQAVEISIGNQYQRNICGQGDVDWFRVNLGGHEVVQIRAESLSGGAAAKISVYDADGNVMLMSRSATSPGSHLLVVFPVEGRETVLIKVESAFPDLFGSDVRYGLRVDQFYPVYMPEIHKNR